MFHDIIENRTKDDIKKEEDENKQRKHFAVYILETLVNRSLPVPLHSHARCRPSLTDSLFLPLLAAASGQPTLSKVR